MEGWRGDKGFGQLHVVLFNWPLGGHFLVLENEVLSIAREADSLLARALVI